LVKQVNIPLPSLEEQNQIVAEIEKEETMVESVKQLIGVFEKKIKDRIDEIWGK
jgi:type I restriction enzyme M protein